jgi:hypothetical protein
VTFTPLPDMRGQFQLGDGVTGYVDLAPAPGQDFVPLPDRRLVIVGVKLEAKPEAPIDTDVWRRVPLGYLTQLANVPQNRKVIANTGHVKVEVGRARQASYRLKPPAERRYPDRFYGKVAAAYERAVTERQAPAQTIADVNEVPVTTVHRWIRETRRRGLLQPARGNGQAG